MTIDSPFDSVRTCSRCGKDHLIGECRVGIAICHACGKPFHRGPCETPGPVDPKPEMVNRPAHYQGKGGMEAIDVIEAFSLGFNLGSAIKYVLRCGRKGDRIEDLKKARYFIDREIKLADSSAS